MGEEGGKGATRDAASGPFKRTCYVLTGRESRSPLLPPSFCLR